MSTASNDAPPKAQPTMMNRVGTGGTVLSAVVLAVPVGYLAYANANTVTLSSADAVKNTLTLGLVLTGLAALIGLIATALNAPGLIKSPSAGRVASTGVSAIVLVGAALFLVLNLLPRVTPLNHLSNDLQPFGATLTKDCSTPLTKLSADENSLYTQAGSDLTGDAAGDASFAGHLATALATMQADSTALSTGVSALSLVTVPDAKYQDLVTRCVTDMKGQIGFLTNESSIPLPPPFSSLVASVSFETLLQDAAGIITGQVPTGLPAGAIPAGTFQTFVRAILKGDASLGVPASKAALCQTDPQLTSDASQLYNDAVSILTTNTAPFKPDIAAIVGTNSPGLNYCQGLV